jgi:hypothetical protein
MAFMLYFAPTNMFSMDDARKSWVFPVGSDGTFMYTVCNVNL